MIQPGKRRVVCHGTSHCGEAWLYERRGSAVRQGGKGRRAGTKASGDCGSAGRRLARGGRDDRRHGSSNAPEGLINKPSPGAPGKLSDEHKAYLTCLIEEGPIPAIHGVVRWRACDLIMQLHEKFGLSVSDDTIYRALKDLGFSHVSARPKAYKQNPDAMDAFKKTLPYAWRRSAKSSRRAHR
jgi:transposase